MANKIPVVNVALWLNSKYQLGGDSACTLHSFQAIAEADAFLKEQSTLQHWIFQVNWEDGTSQKGYLFDKQLYINQWLKTWADRMINGPKEAPENERAEFVRQTKELQPKLVQHAHKLLNELQLD